MKTGSLIRNIYLHIPFCVKKCSYCDFAIHALGNFKENFEHGSLLQDMYVSQLIKEIQITSKFYSGRFLPGIYSYFYLFSSNIKIYFCLITKEKNETDFLCE